MAVWQPTNSMLTATGVEILNKLKAGEGSITISRIVAGSGRADESKLYTQTEIKGTQKEMTLYNKAVLDGGSEISFFITNEGFDSEFHIHQIGIYVTHPDYSGEKLYLISQCDDEGHDVVPTASATPVRLEYSVFLEHGNSESIEITIDPLGAVSTSAFEAYKIEVSSSFSLINQRFDVIGYDIASVKEDIEANKADADSQFEVLGNAVGDLANEVSNIRDSMGEDLTEELEQLEEELNSSIKEVSDSVSGVSSSLNEAKKSFNVFKSGVRSNQLITADYEGNLTISGKINASGKSISVFDAADHRALALSIKGVSSQATTPSPASPVPFKNSKIYDVRCIKGNNLFNVQGTMLRKSTAKYGAITVTGNKLTAQTDTTSTEAPYLGYLMPIEVGKTYVMSYTSMANSKMSYIQLDKPITDITSAEHGTIFTSGTKFTATKPFLLVCTYPSNYTSIGYGYGFDSVKVEEGTVKTDFNPYVGKVITFPSVIELNSVGDYRDTIEWDGAKWWKVQRIAEVILDGTTNKIDLNGGNYQAANYTQGKVYIGSESKVVSNAMVNSPVTTSHGNTTDTSNLTQSLFGYYDKDTIMVHFLNSALGITGTTLSGRTSIINNWITSQNTAGTPFKVRYVLATPIVTEISVSEVLEMYSGLSNVMCSAEDNAPTLDLDYAVWSTDTTTMYILKALARKSEVSTANTFVTTEVI